MKSILMLATIFSVLLLGACDKNKSGGGSASDDCSDGAATESTETTEPVAATPDENSILLTYAKPIFKLQDTETDPCAESTVSDEDNSTEDEEEPAEDTKPEETTPDDSTNETVPITIPELGAFNITAPAASSTHPNPLLTFEPSTEAVAYLVEICGASACKNLTLDPVLHKDGSVLPTLRNGSYTVTMSAVGAFGQEKSATNSPYDFSVSLTTNGTWEPTDPFGAISARTDALAFWTGSKMLVWGDQM